MWPPQSHGGEDHEDQCRFPLFHHTLLFAKRFQLGSYSESIPHPVTFIDMSQLISALSDESA